MQPLYFVAVCYVTPDMYLTNQFVTWDMLRFMV